ncbi:MAG TPA: hypothetical protein VM307_02785 [Egibacteraceae bacterium]|nr:hypothetical protein [Egibacteraceae bacterium]
MRPPADPDWDEGPSFAEVIRRYRVWIVVVGLVCAAAAGLYTNQQPLRYQATATLLLSAPDPMGTFGRNDPSRRVRNQVERLTSRDVASRAADRLGEGWTAGRVLGAISVDAEFENDVITVSAVSMSPEIAPQIANAVAEGYQEAVQEQVQDNAEEALAEIDESSRRLRVRIANLDEQLVEDPEDAGVRAQRDALVAQLATLTGRADQIAVDASLYGSGVELFERAEAPGAPMGRGMRRNAAGGFLAGAALATGVAWVLTGRRTKADDRHDPAEVLGVGLLGPVPRFESVGVDGVVPTLSDPRSPAAEAYQFLVTSLTSQLRRSKGNTVIVTSPQPGDGKTVTALNLAVAASRDDRDILLVDADARVRGLSRLTGMTEGAGLHELQEDPDNLVWSDSRRDYEGAPGLEIVPLGRAIKDPAGFFRTTAFGDAMRRIRDHADMVFIDTPPLLPVSDTWAIADHVDAIVLVITQGTPLPVLEEVRERLALLQAPVLGYVFNGADEHAAPYAYQYGPYHGAAEVEQAPPAKQPPPTEPPPSSSRIDDDPSMNGAWTTRPEDRRGAEAATRQKEMRP